MCLKVGRHTFSENSIISHGSQELKGKFLSQEGCLGSGETNKIQQRKGCRIFCLTFLDIYTQICNMFTNDLSLLIFAEGEENAGDLYQ